MELYTHNSHRGMTVSLSEAQENAVRMILGLDINFHENGYSCYSDEYLEHLTSALSTVIAADEKKGK